MMTKRVLSIEETIQIGGVYKHFKGTEYKVLNIIKDATEKELRTLVIYMNEDSGDIWAREIYNFAEYVFKDGEWKKRFELMQ